MGLFFRTFRYAVVLAFVVAGVAQAQTSLRVSANTGGFSMRDLKQFQKEVAGNLPFPVTITSYPSFIGYEAKLLFSRKKFEIGPWFAFNSTGGRISYSDYSGGFYYNELLQIFQFGASGALRLTEGGNRWQVNALLDLGVGQTNYEFEFEAQVNSAVIDSQNLEFVSFHYLAKPSISVKRILSDVFFVHGDLGFMLDSGGILKFKEDKNLNLINQNGAPIGPNWSGWRVTIGVGMRL